MIENKTITIKKSNTFDKGWTLVAPYQTWLSKNRHFSALSVTDIVRAITQSVRVNLILSEPCLSSQIIKELEWVNKYVAINLIARNKEIVARYGQLKFTKIEIDEGIDFNYIAIKGKTDLYALIAEYFVAVDEKTNKVYFENAKADAQYDFLKDVKSVIFVDERNEKNYGDLVDACLKAKIPTAYLVGTKVYSQQLVQKFLKSDSRLFCSENVRNGILYSTDSGRLYCVNLTSKGLYVSVEIESALYFVGQTFASLKFADIVDVSKIPNGSYICENGKAIPLKIAKEKVIERTVQIAEMADFVSERFDKSETDKHNKYCTEAEAVVYNFTLVPPLFKTDKIANIYDDVEAVYAAWRKNTATINLSEIIAFLKELELSESGLCLLCEQVVGFNKRLDEIIKNHNYKNYYTEINTLNELVNYSTIVDYCKELFSKLNAERSETKFDKFDVEIAGYRQTIEEKKALIAQKIEVLSNKRRVEILEKKIADLTAMKQRFTGSASERDNKQLDVFLTICRQVIEGKFVEGNREIDSIGNVLSAKEVTKIAKLELFVKSYLYEFNKLMISAKEILTKFEAIDIPTDYVVYEQDGKRVIAIESEQEYFDTENIRKHFNLNCVVRR